MAGYFDSYAPALPFIRLPAGPGTSTTTSSPTWAAYATDPIRVVSTRTSRPRPSRAFADMARDWGWMEAVSCDRPASRSAAEGMQAMTRHDGPAPPTLAAIAAGPWSGCLTAGGAGWSSPLSARPRTCWQEKERTNYDDDTGQAPQPSEHHD